MKPTSKKWTRLIARVILTLLIACSVNYTASAQNNADSTYCFTHSQVQQFLRTKVELNQCLESNEILIDELNELTAQNSELFEDLENKKTKLKRTRKFMFGSMGLAGLFAVLFIIK